MCKWNKWGDTRIDPCMREYIKMINKTLLKIYETKSCCCGHGKYPRTVVVGLKKGGDYCFDLISGQMIYRKAKFYKRDQKGVYYIPECVLSNNSEVGGKDE